MIYMTPDLLTWKPLFESWLAILPPSINSNLKTLITSLFDFYVEDSLDFIKAHLSVSCEEVGTIEGSWRGGSLGRWVEKRWGVGEKGWKVGRE